MTFDPDFLRALLHAAPDAIIVVGTDGEIVYANQQTEALFGWTHEELLSRPVEDLLPDRFRDRHPDLRRTYADHATTRPMGTGLTLAARRRDGTEIPIEISLSPIESGEGVLYAAAIRDVTERVEMERERNQRTLVAREEQSQRLESLGQLAGGIAHDFNNLLSVILGHVTLSSRHDDLTAVREDLDVIRQAAERAANLTRQLLAFGRRDHVTADVVNVHELLSGFVELIRRTLGDEIQIRLSTASRPLFVFADRNRLEQVLLNLAINARDAMPDGGVLSLAATPTKIGPETAAVHAHLEEGPYIRISLSDTGTGMTPDVVAHAFEPFFTTKPRGEGTGLGLASAYGIVSRSNGTITVDSTPGVGTTMTVLLPASSGSTAGEMDGDGGQTPELGRILVVEDESALRQVTARMLSGFGYDVETAEHGVAALDVLAASSSSFDLVLTDVTMPRMSGPELARELARRYPYIRVLFMSGYAEPLSKLDDDARLLAKPFTEDDLLDAVAVAIGR